jgi:predicted transcriptional regulator
MKQTKLELYLQILGILAFESPLNTQTVVSKLNLSIQETRTHLEFLGFQGLVVNFRLGNQKTAHSITERGIIILSRFGLLAQET